MTKKLSIMAFILGALIVLWMATNFIGSNTLAFGVTAIIAFVYIVGFMELWRYQSDTRGLTSSLSIKNDQPVMDLDSWVQKISPSLHSSVRLRIKGEHVGLPGPMLTPYLVGLLIMLGLLGTFAGMVDTLKGAVAALEGTSELQAIRAGLASPIKGLSMAFGTSVAGVAASAVLGFISTLSRRERLLASRFLDAKITTVFQHFSLSFNREKTFNAMQQQADSLPKVIEQLSAVAQNLEHFGREVTQSLQANQTHFFAELKDNYIGLASSVESTLKQSIEQNSQVMSEQLQPLLNETASMINGHAESTHRDLTHMAEQHLTSLAGTLSEHSAVITDAWQQGLSSHQKADQQLIEHISSSLNTFDAKWHEATDNIVVRFNDMNEQWLGQQKSNDETRLRDWQHVLTQTSDQLKDQGQSLAQHTQQSSDLLLTKFEDVFGTTQKLIETRVESEEKWLSLCDANMTKLFDSTAAQLTQLRDEEQGRGEAAVERLSVLHSDIAQHIQRLGVSLEAPMTRLIDMASETPKAAAEVIAKLRNEVTQNIERDNQLLEERQSILQQLHSVSESLQQSSESQRQALEQMVSASSSVLNTANHDFAARVEGQASHLSEMVDLFSVSSIELSSLGDAFTVAIKQFSDSNTALTTKLLSLETAIESSTLRSDEQMGYYVAQAREIIDHNMLSQQELIENIRQSLHSTHTDAEKV